MMYHQRYPPGGLLKHEAIGKFFAIVLDFFVIVLDFFVIVLDFFVIVLEAAIDNRDEPDHLPLSPWN